MAKLTPFSISTPPTEIICKRKQSADLQKLDSWMTTQLQPSTNLVISAELFIYGGLISSRITNDTTDSRLQRLNQIVEMKKKQPTVKIYFSTVVMRIPHYNGDFEEPWYWDQFGEQLYQYSYHLHRFEETKDPDDQAIVEKLTRQIPATILKEFLWRRERNFNVTQQVLVSQQQFLAGYGIPLFEQIYITLDDNAPYGLNIKEANLLRDLSQRLQLDKYMNIYPGADEVNLAVLSRLSVAKLLGDKNVPIAIVYRNESTKHYIPNYEGQPLNMSILSQVKGCGGFSWTGDINNASVILLVNNWNTQHQEEAPNAQSPVNYDGFLPYLSQQYKDKVIAFADVRYSNGGDTFFFKWMQSRADLVDLRRSTYAGWNTNGNTLGTVISNAVVLSLFQASTSSTQEFNVVFQLYRILEDLYYQAIDRTALSNYIYQFASYQDSVTDLSGDLEFYQKFVFKALTNDLTRLKQNKY